MSVTTANYLKIVKYYVDGNQLWEANYPAPESTINAKGTMVDDAEGIYVLGETITQVTGYDVIVIKYNSAGVQQWIRSYDGVQFDNNANTIGIGVYHNINDSNDYLYV